MKKVLIFLMAVSLFASCNNDKNGRGKYDRDRNSSDNRDRDDYRNDDRNSDKNNDRDNNDDRNTDKNNDRDNNDNSGSWSKSDENKFMDDCEGTAKENVGAARANEYCDCMLQKIKKMYSSYTEADRELAGSSQDEINKLAADCNGQ
jgi:Ni/Co efflux regulator RcnB